MKAYMTWLNAYIMWDGVVVLHMNDMEHVWMKHTWMKYIWHDSMHLNDMEHVWMQHIWHDSMHMSCNCDMTQNMCMEHIYVSFMCAAFICAPYHSHALSHVIYSDMTQNMCMEHIWRASMHVSCHIESWSLFQHTSHSQHASQFQHTSIQHTSQFMHTPDRCVL